MLQKLFLAASLSFLASCASVGVQTRAVLNSPPDIPPRAQIQNVPFENQTQGYCGPSALAMVMQWTGQTITVGEIAPEVYIDGQKGSLQTDLISASRRHGLLAVPIQGMEPLLKELAAGHPVIVFENLGFSWYPQWHYSVAIGYDLESQELIMHSGKTANKHLSLNHFERGWKLGDYW